MTDEEVPLPGGMGSGGAVVRVGNTVRRPLRPESPAVHAFLHHLEEVGFDGAPRHLGTDDQGRAILSYIDGEVGIPPYPAWTASEALLTSVAALQGRLHEAARSFVAPASARWQTANLPEPGPDAIVCHNDLCVENVVTRDGRAVAFIDFDFAAPADPIVDIGIAARHWAPVRDPDDIRDGRMGVDQVRRFRMFCAAHGLDAATRARVVDECLAFLDRALVSMKMRADEGQPLYVVAWNEGYAEQNRRSRRWLEAHASALLQS
jgi:Ser/Thr protein kinase RdoA (MazF antagonist)